MAQQESKQSVGEDGYGAGGLKAYNLIQSCIMKVYRHYMEMELGRPPKPEELTKSFFETGQHRKYRIFYQQSIARINEAAKRGILEKSVEKFAEEFFEED